MASAESVVLALLAHLIIRCVLYIKAMPTSGPVMPTILVCLAVLDVIGHTVLLPRRFENMSAGFKYVLEAMLAIVLLQTSMILWQSIERTIHMTTQSVLLSTKMISKDTYNKQQNIIIGSFTVPISLAIYVITIQVYT